MAKTYEYIQTGKTLNRVKEERMPFDWSINPYRGCSHGCNFCYARAFQSFIGRGADDEFQNHIQVKSNAAEALEEQLHRMAVRHRFDLEALGKEIGHVAIGTATDPYQGAENRERITRQCLEVLCRYRISVSITTRSPLILRDLDLLERLPLLSVNISLNTVNASVVRSLEPGAPLPSKRLEAAARLAEKGIPVGVFAAPILPGLTDTSDELEALMAAAKENGAAFVMTSLLRLTPDVKGWYYGILRLHYPKLIPLYDRLYQGAYASQSYAEELRERTRSLLRRYQLAGQVPDLNSLREKSISAWQGSPSAFHSASVPGVVDQMAFPF